MKQARNLQQLTADLSVMAGEAVEITIRGEKLFTISMDCLNEAAVLRLVDFFKSAGAKSVEAFMDEECELSGVWVSAA